MSPADRSILTVSSEAASEAGNTKPLPLVWNESKSDFAFRYKHSQSALEFLVKIGRLGGKAVVNGLGLGDDKVHTFDVAIKDFLSETSFPFTKAANDDDQQSIRDLTNLFISAARVADFASLFKINIIQSLTPGLQKEGYTESAQSTSQQSRDPAGREQERHTREDSRRQPPMSDPVPPAAQPRPFHDPLSAGPRRPMPDPMPGFDNEYEIGLPGRSGGFGGLDMPTSGERDLYPPGLGPHDPLRIGPMGGGRRGGGGGMYPAADDPMFGGMGGDAGYDHR